MNKQNMEQVSFEELWTQLKGSTSFGQDELIEMLSYQDDQGENFYIYHRHKAFCVPLHKIKEFFTRHPKPVPPMTKDQELIYLRDKVKKLQDEVEMRQAGDQGEGPAPDETEALENPLPDDLPSEESESEPVPVEEPGEDPKVIPPKKDEAIPPPHLREKMSLKETRAMLAKDLKNAKTPKKKVTDSAEPKTIDRAPKK